MRFVHLLPAFALLLTTGLAEAFTVNSSGAGSDASPGNGECWTGVTLSGGVKECTLLAAIREINATPAGGTIDFAMDTITGANALPPITTPVTIDGTSQGHVEIIGRINGSDVTLELRSVGSTVRRLVLGDGIRLLGGGGHVVEECYIGTGPTSVEARNGAGLQIVDSANNRISDNVISGNTSILTSTGLLIKGATSSGNVVQGNFLGTDASGTIKVANASGVTLFDAPSNLIGGPGEGTRNIISGNGTGVVIFGASASGNTVSGNIIGLDVTGTVALEGSGGNGVAITDAPNNTITGNVISGNNNGGVRIQGTTASGNQVLLNNLGTDLSGLHEVLLPAMSVRRQLFGVRITNAPNNVVGGAGLGNVIAGNVSGVIIEQEGATGNRVQGNDIGPNAQGDGVGNSARGVSVAAASDNLIGGLEPDTGNTIAYNAETGVLIQGGISDAIVGNRIFANGELGIDLGRDGVTDNDPFDDDVGANNLQNFPELTAAKNALKGTLTTTPGTYRIEFFSVNDCDPDGHGEGEVPLGVFTGTTNPSGLLTFTPPAVPRGRFLTATATLLLGGEPKHTSEFSACAAAPSTGSAKPSLVVDSVGDEPDTQPGDGACRTAAGTCTLRAAIQESNVLAKRQVVTFNIAGTPPFTIKPGPPGLPVVDRQLVIDAMTQPGAGPAPAVELDGSNAGPGADGLTFTDGKSILRGLAIDRFAGHGLVLRGKGKNVIEGNFIGTDPSGTTARPNGLDGLFVHDSPKNIIGSLTLGFGNLVSGNLGHGINLDIGADSTVIVGNAIGTNASRTAAIPNLGDGLVVGSLTSKTVVGVAGTGNVISGNGGAGIAILGGVKHRVLDNRIGVDDASTTKIPNARGIVVVGAKNTDIGDPKSPNVVSGNSNGGIVLQGAADNDVIGNLIGTDAGQTLPLGNGGAGIDVINSTGIGVQANTVAANDFGIRLDGAVETFVQGNIVGDAKAGTGLGNVAIGVVVLNDAHDNQIGGERKDDGNTIAHNGGPAGSAGLRILSGVRNQIRHNDIFGNAEINIDLGNDGATLNDGGDGDTGPNALQNVPEILSASRIAGVVEVAGRLISSTKGKFEVDFFLSDACTTGAADATRFWKTVRAGTGDTGSGEFRIKAKETKVPIGSFIAATVTDKVGNTSELSACFPISGAP